HLAVQIPSEGEDAIRVALADEDERALRIGVNAARTGGLPESAVPNAVARLEDAELSADVILSVLRLLSGRSSPELVDALLGFVLHGRKLLGRQRFAQRSPVMLTALEQLAAIRSDDARVQAALELARASEDPMIREAAGGL